MGEFQYESIPDLTARFGEEWIGPDFDVEIILSVYQGFPFKIWVSATWRFSRDGTLEDIIVKKQADTL